MTATIILGGGLIKDNQTGRWRTTNFDESGDNFGVTGDRLRVEAGNYLYQDNPEILIIASGGTGQLTGIPGIETLATVIKRELMELGVPAEKIVEEDQSGTSYRQLLKFKQLIPELKLDQLLIITNKWHLPRVKTMAELAPELGSQLFDLADIKFIAAEQICLDHDQRRWQSIISKAYKSKELKKRVAIELKGINDIKAGRYKYK